MTLPQLQASLTHTCNGPQLYFILWQIHVLNKRFLAYLDSTKDRKLARFQAAPATDSPRLDRLQAPGPNVGPCRPPKHYQAQSRDAIFATRSSTNTHCLPDRSQARTTETSPTSTWPLLPNFTDPPMTPNLAASLGPLTIAASPGPPTLATSPVPPTIATSLMTPILAVSLGLQTLAALPAIRWPGLPTLRPLTRTPLPRGPPPVTLPALAIPPPTSRPQPSPYLSPRLSTGPEVFTLRTHTPWS